jgi:hypothetical protein
LIYISSTEYFYDKIFITQTKEFKYSEIDKSFGAVVVLGLGVIENSPSFKLPPEAFKNFLYALYLASIHNVPIIFSGRGTLPLSESEATNQTLDKISIIYNKKPNLNIIFETKSKNTYENAKFTKEILKNLNLKDKNIALVTSSWHIKRAYSAFREFNISCVLKPSEAFMDNKITKKEYNIFSFMPNIDYFKKSHTNIKEFFGTIALYIKGLF